MINLISKEQQLDFDDVLIIPELTTLNSRKDVNLVRDITCIISGRTITGIPIISANMDKVSTVAAANVLGDYQCFSALHKFVTDEELKNIKHKDKTFLSFGIVSMEEISNKLSIAGVQEDEALLCLDVANGGMYKFLHFIEDVREKFPKAFIIAGNCASIDVATKIQKAGASMVKVGIGSGCFIGGTKVLTKDGYRNIEDISVGDIVLTHRGNWKKVIEKMTIQASKSIKINDIECTPNHEFYVLHKKFSKIVNDNNIHEYAQWVCAEDLTEEYLLIEVT